MTDPADRHLEERLHALARGVGVPVVPAEADVRRGRRRLVKVRLAMAGAATGTLAVVLGVTGLTAGDPTATEPPAVTQPSSVSAPATPQSSPSPDGEAESHGAGEQEQGVGGQGPGGSGPGATGSADADAATGADDADDADDTAKLPGGAPTGEAEGTAGGGNPAHWPSHGPTGPSDEPSDDPTGEPTGEPTDDPTGDPTDPPTVPPTVPPTEPPGPPPTSGKIRVHRVLAYYNAVVAEHVDPDRTHLQDYDRTVDPRSTSRSDGRLFALGSTYRWENAHETADLRVRVASGWDQVAWECGSTPTDWQCHAGPVAAAEVAVHDGLREVAVEHADGQVVVVGGEQSADGLTEDELVAAALDERLVVPGDAPVAPPRLDAGAFGSSGELAMVRTGEGFTTTGYTRSPSVRGTLVVDGTERTVSWSAAPTYSGGGWECLRTFRSCTEVVVDDAGTVVHVGVLKKKAGWVVQYDGPSYAVRVTSSDPGLAKKRAYPFVVDPAWQPERPAP